MQGCILHLNCALNPSLHHLFFFLLVSYDVHGTLVSHVCCCHTLLCCCSLTSVDCLRHSRGKNEQRCWRWRMKTNWKILRQPGASWGFMKHKWWRSVRLKLEADSPSQGVKEFYVNFIVLWMEWQQVEFVEHTGGGRIQLPEKQRADTTVQNTLVLMV